MKRSTAFIVAGMLLVILGVMWVGYDGRQTVAEGQRAACERGKLDRTASAESFRAQSDYLELVLDATSVREDVKTAARINQAIQNASASSLESRTGDNLDCARSFPDAQFIPIP